MIPGYMLDGTIRPVQFEIVVSLVTWITIGDRASVWCHPCGRGIAGPRPILEEAHRQHVLRHPRRSR